jgi:tetratricopeptide (TPR) repeat protein
MTTEAEERHNEPMRLVGLMSQLTLYATPNPVRDPDLAQALSESTLALAQKLGDAAAEAQIWRNLCIHYTYNGQFEEGIASGQRSLTLARQHQLREQLAYTLNDIATHSYEVIGRLRDALGNYQEAIQLWRELDNQPMLADSLSGATSISTFLGEYETAVAFAQEALQISQRIGNVWGQSYSQYRLGTIYWDNGRTAAAIAVMKESIYLSEQAGFIVPQGFTRAELGGLYVNLGDFVHGRALIEQAISTAQQYMPIMQVFGRAWLADAQVSQGQLDEAEATIAQAQQEMPSPDVFYFFDLPLRMAAVKLWLRRGDGVQARAIMQTVSTDMKRIEAGQFRVDVLYLEAQVWLLQGDVVKGREKLLSAQKTAVSRHHQRLLWQILHSLSQIEPDPQQAIIYQQEAQTIIHFIANHAPPDLRQSFLNLPHVREIMGRP